MEPTGSYTNWFNTDIITDLNMWNRNTNAGYVFGHNAGFTLPNKAVRSPDGAFVSRSRYEELPQSDRKRFSPDFVIELLSESNHEEPLQKKMREWIDNGCRLAWMISLHKREMVIYRTVGNPETKPFREILSGEDVLPGFELNLDGVFSDA